MFSVTKFELRKNRNFVFYIYCVGKVTVPDYFFSEFFLDLKIKEIGREKVGIFSLLKLRNSISNEYCLVFCEKSNLLKLLLNLNAHIVPFLVDQSIDLSVGKKGVYDNYHKHLKSKEFRKLKRFRYTCEVKNKADGLKKIYEKMYLPIMKERLKIKAEKFSDFKKYFKDSYLLVSQNKIAVGFVSLMKENKLLIVRRSGVLDASKELYSKSIMIALYYFLVEYALKSKFAFLSLGYSAPSLNNGVLIYKNKWGAKISHNDEIFTFYFGVGKINKQISEIFYGKPLICMKEDRLGALVFGGKGNKFFIKKINKMIDISFFQGIDFLLRFN